MQSHRILVILAVVGLLTRSLIASAAIAQEIVARDGNLVKYDTGLVLDTASGLEWYAGPDRGMSWEEARSWVSELDVFGDGWRMPAKKELDTFFRIGDGVRNITRLLDNSGYWLWAGDTHETAARWLFNFSYGGEGWSGQPPAEGGRAIAVRDDKKR